jgi:hypothetical protein
MRLLRLSVPEKSGGGIPIIESSISGDAATARLESGLAAADAGTPIRLNMSAVRTHLQALFMPSNDS